MLLNLIVAYNQEKLCYFTDIGHRQLLHLQHVLNILRLLDTYASEIAKICLL